MPQNLLQATSNMPAVLFAKQLTAAEAAQYTAPANSAVKIISAVLCNTSAANATISVSVVPTGGTAGPANRILSSFTLAPADSLTLTEIEGAMLGPGDSISAISSVASVVSFVVTGAVSS
jgi:hypothetical protein